MRPRSAATAAMERAAKTSHCAQGGPPIPRATSAPVTMAPSPKKSATRPPGVTTSKTSSPIPTRIQIHHSMQGSPSPAPPRQPAAPRHCSSLPGRRVP